MMTAEELNDSDDPRVVCLVRHLPNGSSGTMHQWTQRMVDIEGSPGPHGFYCTWCLLEIDPTGEPV